MDVVQRLKGGKWPSGDVVPCRYNVQKVMYTSVMRAPERRVRSRRHPRMLVGQIAEFAPLPSIQRLAEGQAVDDVRDIRSFRVLRLLRLVRGDVKIPGHAVHEDVASYSTPRIIIIPVVMTQV